MGNKNIIYGIIVIIFITLISFLLIKDSSKKDTERSIQQKETQTQEESTFSSITSTELVTMLQQKNFTFVNVHIPYEGEIENTDIFIPYNKIVENLDKLPDDKNAKIVLYCRSGNMSGVAAKELARLGYTNVSHLAGGMIDWKNNDYQLLEE